MGVAGVSLGLTAAPPVAAEETAGRIGVGATLPRDLSLSYGISERTVLEAGFGFASFGDDTRDTEFSIGASIRSALVKGDKADLNFEVGLQYESLSEYPSGAGGADVFTPMAGLHVLFWLSRNFTVGAAHGIALEFVSPDSGNSTTNIRSYAGNLTHVSFTYWLDPE
jgi:hypothetical protein